MDRRGMPPRGGRPEGGDVPCERPLPDPERPGGLHPELRSDGPRRSPGSDPRPADGARKELHGDAIHPGHGRGGQGEDARGGAVSRSGSGSDPAQQVLDAVRVRHGDIGHEHTVQQPTRGAGALAAGIARMNAQREETRAAQAAAASAPVRVITPAQVAANEEPRPAAQPSRAEENAARNRFFGHHNAGVLDRQVYLENTTPGHNKLYVIDLRQVGEGQWVVNAGNGRIDGRSMTVRTKTDRPMSQAAANALVSQIKAEKINGGYHPIEDSASPRHRFTNMDQFNHPAVNIDTPIQGGVIRPAGVSVQTPARPAVATTPVPTPAPAATPAAAAPAPAPASAATTRALAATYSSLRQTADLGNA